MEDTMVKKNQKNILIVIPARGGSKGVKNKNIKKLRGKPLIQYTFETIKNSKHNLDYAISTDSDNIIDVCKKFGANVYFKRPKSLAEDSTLTLPVVKHAIKKMEKIKNKSYEIIVLLQPTSPIRDVKKLDRAIKYLIEEQSTSVCSVANVNGNHPFRMKRIVGGKCVNFIDQGFEDMRPRQVLPDVYIRSGSIYAILKEEMYKTNLLVTDDCIPIILDGNEAINIDNSIDFATAELLIDE